MAGELEREEIKIREISCSNPSNKGLNGGDGIGKLNTSLHSFIYYILSEHILCQALLPTLETGR